MEREMVKPSSKDADRAPLRHAKEDASLSIMVPPSPSLEVESGRSNTTRSTMVMTVIPKATSARRRLRFCAVVVRFMVRIKLLWSNYSRGEAELERLRNLSQGYVKCHHHQETEDGG